MIPDILRKAIDNVPEITFKTKHIELLHSYPYSGFIKLTVQQS